MSSVAKSSSSPVKRARPKYEKRGVFRRVTDVSEKKDRPAFVWDLETEPCVLFGGEKVRAVRHDRKYHPVAQVRRGRHQAGHRDAQAWYGRKVLHLSFSHASQGVMDAMNARDTKYEANSAKRAKSTQRKQEEKVVGILNQWFNHIDIERDRFLAEGGTLPDIDDEDAEVPPDVFLRVALQNFKDLFLTAKTKDDTALLCLQLETIIQITRPHVDRVRAILDKNTATREAHRQERLKSVKVKEENDDNSEAKSPQRDEEEEGGDVDVDEEEEEEEEVKDEQDPAPPIKRPAVKKTPPGRVLAKTKA